MIAVTSSNVRPTVRGDPIGLGPRVAGWSPFGVAANVARWRVSATPGPLGPLAVKYHRVVPDAPAHTGCWANTPGCSATSDESSSAPVAVRLRASGITE